MKRHIPMWIYAILLAACGGFFFYYALAIELIPTAYLLLAGAVIALLALVALLLSRSTKKPFRFVLGTLLTLFLAAALLAGGYYLRMTYHTLHSITQVVTQYTPVAVFVRTDDPAENLTDAAGYTFAIAADTDRDAVDTAIADIESKLEASIATQEYETYLAAVNALLEGDVDALIINAAYIELLEGTDEYSDIYDRIRSLEMVTVQTEVEVPAETQTQATDATDATDETGDNVEIPANDHVFTLYISGSDTRYGLNSLGRSDVNILGVVNTETHQVLLISTPRDYYVPLSISNGVRDKLTHAGIYGIQVSVDTMELLYDIEIDYYFRLNFTGFVNIIDALGGVSFYNTAPSSLVPAGYVTLTGEEALAFARDRYSYASGDLQRGKNQMTIIKAVIEKALSSTDVLANYASIMASLEGSFETTVPYSLIASIVSDQLATNPSWDIVSYEVTGTGDSQIPYSMSMYAYVMWPDESTVTHAKELMAAVYNDEIISEE
ncbi:MAG: LCP family protein [Firmicutes bacterium]|nr:LCP family protein [Bacillota bacterium]